MADESKPKVTCYSGGEGRFMQATQALRGWLFSPLLGLLARLKIRPNHLTLLSLLAGLAFCPAFLWMSAWIAYALLVAHVLLDGLDGPLARFTGTASNQGSFSDTTSDQVVVAFTTVTMIYAGHASVWAGGLYLFFYTMVVIFAMVRNALAIPYAWLVRPRFLVYAAFPVEVHVWRGSLELLLWVVTVLLAVKMLTGFLRIRKSIPG